MFKFNGLDLEMFVKVISIDTTAMSDRQNNFVNNPSRHGRDYQGYKYDYKKIDVNFDIKERTDEDYQTILDTLCSIFHVDEPKELVIDNNKRIYLAVPDGEISKSKITKGMGRFNISFICPIPFSYEANAKIYNGEKTLSVVNEGNTSTPAIIDITFNGDATYCQIDGQDGKSILIGEYPTLTNAKEEESTNVVYEPCETTENFVSVTGEVDAKRTITGSIQPNDGSSSWCLQSADYGSGDDWHGPALRYNLPSNVEDFECGLYFYHDSKGKLEYNETCATDKVTTTKYKVTATTVKLKQKRLSSSTTLLSIKKGVYLQPTEVTNGWIKTTYNNQTGWVKISTGLKKVTVTTATYYTKQAASLRASGSKSSKLLATIPKGTAILVYPESKSGKYTKCKYKDKTGYVYTDYIIEGDKVQIETDQEVDTSEDKIGLVEAYGFDQAGNKLFKVMLCDENEWYEATYPLVQIGNTEFLKDTSFSVPKAKTTTTTSGSDDSLTVTTKTLRSGKYGNWNEFRGHFTIRREKNEWYAEVVKYNEEGNIERTLKSEKIKKEGFPEGALNHIVIFFGQYADKKVVDTMTFNRLIVNRLNEITEDETDSIIFHQGDELRVDFANNEVLLNNVKDMRYIDIGSEFFEIEPGEYDLKISSDADITSSIIFNERWLD